MSLLCASTRLRSADKPREIEKVDTNFIQTTTRTNFMFCNLVVVDDLPTYQRTFSYPSPSPRPPILPGGLALRFHPPCLACALTPPCSSRPPRSLPSYPRAW